MILNKTSVKFLSNFTENFYDQSKHLVIFENIQSYGICVTILPKHKKNKVWNKYFVFETIVLLGKSITTIKL